MRKTSMIMGMPITIELVGATSDAPIEVALSYFQSVDERFSPFKSTSEVSALNRGEVRATMFSPEMREIMALAETTKFETQGYFDIRRADGIIDPSGLVKGWAIRNAAGIIADLGYRNYFVEAGGDIQCAGHNADGEKWRVGIRNPFDSSQSIKTLQPGDAGIATSGTSIRGKHIYNPYNNANIDEVVSVTIVASDIFDADRFATAAFAMGRAGIDFIEATDGLEGYSIDHAGIATMTSGFEDFVASC